MIRVWIDAVVIEFGLPDGGLPELDFEVFHVCLFIPIVAFRWKMRIVIDVFVLVGATILPFVGVFPDVQDAMNA